MAGYTRQSIADIVNGLDITAPPLTAEFNQIDAAFHGTTGHGHDGSTGNGPKVNLTTSVQGYLPAANGGLGGVNKIDATVAPVASNDNVQGYVPGSIWINTTNGRAYRCVGNATNAAVWREEVLVIGGNQITPIATATVDLGTSAVRFKDAYLGTSNTTGAAVVGGNLSVTGTTTLTGATSVGSITASTGFSGPLTGAVTGNVTGDVAGNLTGNVTAATGTSSFNNVTVNGSLDMNSSTSATVTGLSTPVNATDAATKAYVDTQVDDLVILTLSNAEAATETYVDTADALKLNLTGGTMSGAIAMGTSKITGLGTPTAAADATTKTYVDTADDLKLNLTGGTMSGAIAMGSNKITGLGTPTASTDAVTKGYADTILPSYSGNAGKALLVNNTATGVEWALPAETNYQAFTASGTWTKPAKCTMVYVECIGAGGGGSGLTGFPSGSSYYGGGAGGGFASGTFLASGLASTVTVTVGAFGAGRANGSGGSGADGGSSTFGSHLLAYGGRGGGAGSGTVTALTNTGTSISPVSYDNPTTWPIDGSGGGLGVFYGPGGNAIFGGGGGGGTNGVGTGGISQHHGNGGAGNSLLNTKGGDGVAPGGGGGGSLNNGGGGDGARGEVRIWAW